MSNVEFDATGLQRLEVDLERASATIDERVKPVVSRGALNVKRDWAAAWTGIRGMPALARAVSYDVEVHGRTVEAEIGPDKDRPQGPLGNIVQFGGAKHPPIRPVADEVLATEEPKFIRALGQVGEVL